MIALTLSVGLTDAGGKHMLPLQINIDAVNNSSIFLEVISGDNSHTVFFKYTHSERVLNRAQVMLDSNGRTPGTLRSYSTQAGDCDWDVRTNCVATCALSLNLSRLSHG